MRLILFFYFFALFTSCKKDHIADDSCGVDIFFYQSSNNFNLWEYSHTDSLADCSIDKLDKNYIQLDSFKINSNNYIKYYFSGDGDDNYGVEVVSEKGSKIIGWNLESAALYNKEQNLILQKEIISDSTLFNNQYVPPPPLLPTIKNKHYADTLNQRMQELWDNGMYFTKERRDSLIQDFEERFGD